MSEPMNKPLTDDELFDLERAYELAMATRTRIPGEVPQDAEFIASARAALPRLIAEVRRLLGEQERLAAVVAAATVLVDSWASIQPAQATEAAEDALIGCVARLGKETPR